MLYKIVHKLPSEAKKDGSVDPKTVLPLVPLDLHDGYIHLSTESQVEGTLNKYFTKDEEVVILHVDVPDNKDVTPQEGHTGNKDRSQIKWEWVESRKEYFGHLYGDLLNEDIVKVQVLKNPGTQWKFP